MDEKLQHPIQRQVVMQKNVEKALFNVFQSIGNGYDFPSGEFIPDEFNPGQQFRNPFFGQTPSAVKFAKGTQKELDIWLKDTKDRYPVVWLVYSVTAEFENNISSLEEYPGVRLVFAINNTADKSVDERNQTTRVIIESICEKFLALMRQSSFTKYIRVNKTRKMKRTFHPNYSTSTQQSKSGTIDIWDAITLDCDIILTPSCIPVAAPAVTE